MGTTIRFLVGAGLLAAMGAANAQSTESPCPRLPADTGLTWEYKAAGGTDFCRALRADGSEAFGLYIAAQTPFKGARTHRAEEGTVDGRSMQWYRSELAGQPNVQARETAVSLPDGRVAYLWIQAKSSDELTQSLTQANTLRFDTTGSQLSSK